MKSRTISNWVIRGAIMGAAILSLSVSSGDDMNGVKRVHRGIYSPNDPMPENREAVLAEMAKLKPSTAWVEQRAGSPVLIVDGVIRPVNVYKGKADFKLMGEADTDLIITHCCGQRLFRSMFYDRALFDRYAGRWNFQAVEDVLIRIYHANPRARVLLDVDVDPDRLFLEEHPDEIFRSPDGVRGAQGGPGISSSQFGGFRETLTRPPSLTNNMETWAYCYCGSAWRRRVDEGIAELTRFLRTSPAGNIVVGFAIVGGMDGQFVQWEYSDVRGNFDYSPANHRMLRAWLRKIYPTDEELQAAWGDKTVTLKTAVNPTMKEWESLRFYDDRPGLGRKIADCRRFVSIGLARQLNHFALKLKAGLGRPCVAMTWYTTCIWSQAARCELDELVANEAFNIINTVSQYSKRRVVGGLGASANNMIAGLALRKLIFMQEMDHRSWRSQVNGDMGMKSVAWPENLEIFTAQIERDCGAILAAGGHGWNYYDMFDSWYHDEGIKQLFKRMNALNTFVTARHGQYPRSEVAIFGDEKRRAFAPRTNDGDINYCWRTSGVTPAMHLLTDLTNSELPKYKLIVVNTPVTLTKAQVDRLLALADAGAQVAIFGEVACSSRDFANGDAVKAYLAKSPRITFIPEVDALTPEWLNRQATECGIHVYSAVGNVVTVGNGVAAVHRLEGMDSPTVDFGREVTLIDPLTGEKQPNVRVWRPTVEPKRSAIIGYLW